MNWFRASNRLIMTQRAWERLVNPPPCAAARAMLEALHKLSQFPPHRLDSHALGVYTPIVWSCPAEWERKADE